MPTVRQIADNEWVLLLSRAAAALAVPGVIGAFLFAWNMNAQQAVVTDNLARHETQINANTMALTRAATRASRRVSRSVVWHRDRSDSIA